MMNIIMSYSKKKKKILAELRNRGQSQRGGLLACNPSPLEAVVKIFAPIAAISLSL